MEGEEEDEQQLPEGTSAPANVSACAEDDQQPSSPSPADRSISISSASSSSSAMTPISPLSFLGAEESDTHFPAIVDTNFSSPAAEGDRDGEAMQDLRSVTVHANTDER